VCASSCLMSLTPLRVRAVGVFEGVSVSLSLSVRGIVSACESGCGCERVCVCVVVFGERDSIARARSRCV